MNLPALIPGFIASYDRQRRTVRVRIPGLTDGDELPEAEFNYPIGDKTEDTEIRVLVGDRVWLMFENGDRRYPIVMGYRPKQVGNDVGWRRFAHDNIETTADEVQHHAAGTEYRIEAGTAYRLSVMASGITVEPSRITISTQQVAINAPSVRASGSLYVGQNAYIGNAATGTFTTANGLTVTVQDGIVTNIF